MSAIIIKDMLGFVRHAVPEDAAEIVRLSGHFGYSCELEQVKEALGVYLGSPSSTVFVFQTEEGLAGWIGVRKEIEITTPSYLLITGFVVDEAFRGQGCGKALLTAVYEYASDAGLHKIRLRMNENRLDTHAFYVHNGYVEKKRQVTFEKEL